MEKEKESLKPEHQTKLDFEALDIASPKEQFMMEQNSCPLCGSDLYMTYKTQFVEKSVTEEAFCESCCVRTRVSDHSLQ